MNTLLSLIKKFETIIIHRHINPDGDALSSQFGLKKLIEFNFPDKKVYAVGEKYSEYLRESFEIPDIIEDSLYENALVITVDTANIDRIDDLRWKTGKYIIKIDHHVFVEKYGDSEFVSDSASSCAELIAKFAYDEPTLKINSEIAQILIIGIITDTGRFFHKNTNSDSFFYSHMLMKENFNLQEIYRKLYKKNNNLIKFTGYVTLKYKDIGNISYIILKKGIEKKFNIDYSEASSMVNLISMGENNKYSVYAIWNKKEKKYKISLRSKEKAINEIAKKFHGGGHKNASGAHAKNKEEIKNIIEEIKKLENES